MFEEEVSDIAQVHCENELFELELTDHPPLVNVNPLGPNSDLSQTSHCNIKGLSVREVMRIENIITHVQFY